MLFYLKKFDEHGDILPNVCLVGDLDECFVIHTNALLKYLDEDIDWSVAPSKAAELNLDLVQKISEDADINPFVFVFVVDSNFSFKEVADKITDQANNIKRYVHITEHNLSRIFDYFCNNVLDEKSKSKLSAHDLVEIFMGIISDKMNYYQHTHDPNTLVYNDKKTKINSGKFNSFFSHFDREYTPQETMRLKGIGDRLLEDMQRRKSGDFWTPTIWSDKAHEMIGKQLGTDWKEKYVVWDNCWGTGNLTRDYRFGELYCSTLFESELNIAANYNPEATKFQFDFLNNDIPTDVVPTQTKLPKGLLEAFEQNKPIVFFLNPPYARNGGDGKQAGVSERVAETVANHQMQEDEMGACSANLYGQFLYRIMKIKQKFKLKECYIAIFCPTLFLVGQSFKKFRKVFLDEFSFEDAFQFRASEFANVSDKWGIGFTILKSGKTINKETFEYRIAEYDGEEIKFNGSKIIYNADNDKRYSEYITSSKKRTRVFPTQTNALKIVEKDGIKVSDEFLGTLLNDGNLIDTNPQGVSIFSSVGKKGGNSVVSVETDNFTRCTALFSARKLIEKNWINSKDEYLVPDESHPQYDEFVNDSIVHSLFHSSSQQSSLRQVDYKGKKWDIKNEFFWMSRQEIEQLANSNNLVQTYNDARTSKDRYVYTKLQGITLSPEAQAVLDKACEIVRNTFKYRSMFDSEHPEYQIMNWDCGWYQIKALAQEYAKPYYAEFVKLFKALEEKMRPMVYELGFLR